MPKVAQRHVRLQCGCEIPWEAWRGEAIPWLGRAVSCPDHGETFIARINADDYENLREEPVGTPWGPGRLILRPSVAGDAAWWAEIPGREEPLGPCRSREQAAEFAAAGEVVVDVWSQADELKPYLPPAERQRFERLLYFAATVRYSLEYARLAIANRERQLGVPISRAESKAIYDGFVDRFRSPPEAWRTLRDISLMTGIPHNTLRQWIHREVIAGRKEGGLWLADPLEIEGHRLRHRWGDVYLQRILREQDQAGERSAPE